MYVALEVREGKKDPDNKGPLTGVHVSPERGTRVNKKGTLPVKLLVSSIFMRHLRLCKFWSFEKDGVGRQRYPPPLSWYNSSEFPLHGRQPSWLPNQPALPCSLGGVTGAADESSQLQNSPSPSELDAKYILVGILFYIFNRQLLILKNKIRSLFLSFQT